MTTIQQSQRNTKLLNFLVILSYVSFASRSLSKFIFLNYLFCQPSQALPGQPRSAFRRPWPPLLVLVCSMRAGPSAPTPVSIAFAHCPTASVCAPSLLVPILVPNLPAVVHSRQVPRETKNAIFGIYS